MSTFKKSDGINVVRCTLCIIERLKYNNSQPDVVNSIAIAIVIEKLLNFSSIVTIDIAIEPQ